MDANSGNERNGNPACEAQKQIQPSCVLCGGGHDDDTTNSTYLYSHIYLLLFVKNISI